MATAQQVPGTKVNPGINNMVRIMIKKGVVSDLARVPHSLDLSSPNVATTVNAVLRPLETLSRIVNQPSALGGGAASQKPKPKNSQNNQGNATGAVDAAGNGTAGIASGTVPASVNGSTTAGATTNGSEGRTAGNNGTNTTNSEATRAQVRIKILVEELLSASLKSRREQADNLWGEEENESGNFSVQIFQESLHFSKVEFKKIKIA